VIGAANTAFASINSGAFVFAGNPEPMKWKSSTIIKEEMKSKTLSNITPGEILHEDFLKPLGLSQYRLAKDIGVPARRINEIVKGERAITADTALRLGRFFGMSPQFWLNLQSHYDLELQEDRLGPRLAREVRILKAA
jgi:antitoxin HigA-1